MSAFGKESHVKIQQAQNPIKKKRKNKRKLGNEEKGVIEVRIKNEMQLFDARDPAPFRDKDLDEDFVEYVLASAHELKNPKRFHLRIFIGDRPTESHEIPEVSISQKVASPEEVADAIKDYFDYHWDLKKMEFKNHLKRAQIFFWVGVVLLSMCLSLAQNLDQITDVKWVHLLREGLVIFGWVSIWKPIELLLYDWYPVYEKMDLFKKLSMADVDVIHEMGNSRHHRSGVS